MKEMQIGLRPKMSHKGVSGEAFSTPQSLVRQNPQQIRWTKRILHSKRGRCEDFLLSHLPRPLSQSTPHSTVMKKNGALLHPGNEWPLAQLDVAAYGSLLCAHWLTPFLLSKSSLKQTKHFNDIKRFRTSWKGATNPFSNWMWST